MKKIFNEKSTSTENEKYDSAKRPYIPPRLTEFGHVVKLTQGTGSMNVDSVSGRRKN